MILGELFGLPSNKEEVDYFKRHAIEEIGNGDYPALKTKGQLVRLINMLTDINESEDLRNACLSEIDFENGSEYKSAEFTIKKGEFGTKYDYSGCGHIGYENALKDVEEATKKKKNIEAFLKSLKETYIDEGTGLVYYPPVKFSKTNVSVTFNKK